MQTEQPHVDVRKVDLGKIKAFADVTLPGPLGDITICGFRVMQDDGQDPWVAFPGSSYLKNGEPVRKEILDVSRGTKRQLSNLILNRFKELLSEAKGH